MKRLILLPLLLSACAKAPPEKIQAAVSRSSADFFAPFNHTSSEAEARLLELASLGLRTGATLDSARAEKCWREESKRPQVRESCLLLWAAGSGPSATLEEATLSGGPRVAAVALLGRPSLFGRVDYTRLLSLLDQLEEDPLWLRAELVLAWLGSHGRPGLKEAEGLITRIRPTQEAGPRSLASSLLAIRKLRMGSWQEIFGAYCDPATVGEARLRCWRLLGALSAKPGDLSEFRSFLPPPDDDDWLLFSRTFPHLALKIQAALR